ncbi:MAG: tetratricopeptide repeat protein [Acidobacteriota bacterium]
MIKRLFFIIFLIIIISDFVSAQRIKYESGNVDFLLDLVNGYLNLGMVDEAIDILKKLKDSFPMNYDIDLFLGISFYLKKDFESAFKEFLKIEDEIELEKRLRGPIYVDKEGRSWVESFPQLRKRRFHLSDKNISLLYMGRGLTLRKKGDYKTAEKKLLSALKAGYNELDTRYLLLDIYVYIKDYKKAYENFKRISSIKKEKDEIDYFIEGYLLYYSEKEKEALDSLHDALKINPNFLEAKKNEGCILYNKGDYEKSINTWEEALKISPDDLDSKRNMGRAYFHLGKVDRAKEEFEKLGIKISPKDYSPKKIPLFFIGLESKIKFGTIYEIDFERLLQHGIDLDNLKHYNIKPSMLLPLLNERAILKVREGKIDEAIKILTYSTQIDRGCFYINYNLGQLHFMKNQLLKAKNYALIAIETKKDFFEAHDLLGNIYFREGNFSKSEEEYRKTVEISEKDPLAHYNLGCAYFALNEFDKSEEEWRKAIEYDLPKISKKEMKEKFIEEGLSVSLIVHKESISYRAHISLSSLYIKKDKISKAIEELEEAIELEPNNPEAYFDLGKIYYDRDENDKAIFFLEKHISLGGKNQEEAFKLIKDLKTEDLFPYL